MQHGFRVTGRPDTDRRGPTAHGAPHDKARRAASAQGAAQESSALSAEGRIRLGGARGRHGGPRSGPGRGRSPGGRLGCRLLARGGSGRATVATITGRATSRRSSSRGASDTTACSWSCPCSPSSNVGTASGGVPEWSTAPWACTIACATATPALEKPSRSAASAPNSLERPDRETHQYQLDGHRRRDQVIRDIQY